jgi:hypothetical protein
LVIAGIGEFAAGIADCRGDHPWQPPETLFSSPKTTATKDCLLLIRQDFGCDWRAEYGMQLGGSGIVCLLPITLLKQPEHEASLQKN